MTPGWWHLLLVHPDGTSLHEIAHERHVDWLWPSFSPDGRQIVAVKSPGERSENDVYVMRSDGTDIRAVTTWLSTYPADGLPDWGTAR